ncbi:MAG: polysaccharide export protein [Rhodobiaceae bacterium]|nr:polysaccharide export protein [Rhodobiaceae bacterium]
MLANRVGRVFGLLAIMLALALLLAGCQTTSSRIEHGSVTDGEAYQTSYRLGTDDRIRLIVFGQDDLSNIYTVDAQGTISVPLIGLVPVSGMTTAEVERSVAARLRNGFIRNPDVTVEMQTYRPFFILGEVRQPGQYAFRSGITVKAAVAIAGGYSERAAQRRMKITRTVNGETYRATVPSDAIVMPGDTIEILERVF